MIKFNFLEKTQKLEIVDSTNNFAGRLLKEGNPEEGTVILADFQKAGRGQRDHSWASEKGKNLTFSMILYPVFLNAEKQFFLSMALSIGITRYLQSLIPGVNIKWPNDIYSNNKKIAGVLIENSLKGSFINSSILGIGLNVNQVNFPDDVKEATSLAIELNRQFKKEDIYKNIIIYIDSWIGKLYSMNYVTIKSTYESLLLYKNQLLEFTKDKGIFTGIIQGVNEYGQLLIKKENNSIEAFDYNEISILKK